VDNLIKILCVEDLPSDLELVERELKLNDIKFKDIRVETREEFTLQLAKFKPDIIISDYSLPRFNGMEALFIAQKHSPHTPFIILTGSTNEETAVECMKAGATDYVIKEHLSRIVPAIQSAMSQAKMVAEKTFIEHELDKSHERLRAALEGIRAGVWDWNLKEDIKTFSAEWALMLGYTPKELQYRPEFWMSTVHPDDLSTLLNNLNSYLQGKSDYYENEHRKKTKAGNWIWVLDRGEIVERDKAGKPTHMMGIIIDISERKHLEEKLQLRSERLDLLNRTSQLLNQTLEPDAIYTTAYECIQNTIESCAVFFSSLDPEHDLIHFEAGWKNGKKLDKTKFPTIPLEPPGSGIQSEAIRTRKSMLISDLRINIKHTQSTHVIGSDGEIITDPTHRDLHPTSAIFVPLVVGNRPIGVVQVQNSRLNTYTEEDLQFIESLAQHITLALTNSTLLDQVQRELYERRQAEKELHKKENKYRSLFETSNDAILIINESKISDCNDRATSMFGLRKEELIGKQPEHFSPEHQPNGMLSSQLSDQVSIAIAQSNHTQFEWQFQRPDGVVFESEVNLNQIDLGDDRFLQATIRDITDRKRAEEDRYRLMAAIEQTKETFIITDAEGRIQYVNPAFYANTGYSHSEAIGLNPRILQSGKHDLEFYRKMWETLKSGEVWRGHFYNRHKNGSVFEEEATISPIRDASGRTVNYVAVKRNVTRERQLEDQLQQSQKMEAIGRLAGGVAHDFNNLLTIIQGNAELLAIATEDNVPIQDGLQLIRQTVDRGTALTRQLLAFSRRQPHQPKVVNFNDILQSMHKMLGRLIGEDIELHYLLDNDLPNTKADVGQMEQVIMNIVVNARDAMPNGGKITISTSTTVFQSGEISEPSQFEPGRYCTLAISDIGTGMSKEVREHALEPFFTTKPVGKGTGLGLAMVHGIISQSDGMVQIVSEEGKGTSVFIYLPIVMEAIEKNALVTHDNVLGKNEHILVIEDEKAILDMIKLILTQYGYHVTTARNGKEALSLLLHEPNGFNLILTDVIMPQLSGPQLVEWAKARYPGTKVVYTSGYTTEVIVHQIQDQGYPFLQKPFKTSDLLKVIRTALDTK